MELEGQKGRPEGKLYQSTSITGRAVNYRLNRRILNSKESSVTGPNRERSALHLLQAVSHPCKSASEKPSSPWTLVFLQTSFTQSNIYLLLHKTPSLSLVCWTCLWFCRSLKITIPCYSRINAFWWYDNCLFYFLRLTDPILYSTNNVRAWRWVNKAKFQWN